MAHVYNPWRYAWSLHEAFVRRFVDGPVPVLFLGMNPGPWGMGQTGVPFGEVAAVRDWMGLAGEVGQPLRPHPKRPVQGLACSRSEVSGRRLWGWVADRFGAPEAFFEQAFVLNHCPLLFLAESGRNLTPDKLAAEEREPLLARCDAALRDVVAILEPEWAVGVGAYAEARLRAVLEGEMVRGEPVKIGRILHPSPASPAANRGWVPQAEAQLREQGVPLGGVFRAGPG